MNKGIINVSYDLILFNVNMNKLRKFYQDLNINYLPTYNVHFYNTLRKKQISETNFEINSK